MNLIKWMLITGQVVLYFAKLLETQFVPGSSSNNTPIGRALQGMVLNYPTHMKESRFTEYAKMYTLMNDFETLKKYNLNLFESYRKKIKDAKTDQDYVGIRFEIEMIAIFIRLDIDFKMPEPPDFRINYNSHEIIIECTSIQYHKTKLTNPFKKIGDAIKEKSKIYCNHNTALFIDITNIIFHHHNDPKFIDEGEVKKYVLEKLKIRNFGSILLIFHISNPEVNTYAPKCFRTDSPLISEYLKQLLAKLFPFEATESEGHFPKIP